MKKNIFLISLLLFVMSLSFVSAASTLTVCSTGCDYTNIQSAIDAASNNDIIDIKAGNYGPTAMSWDGSKFLYINKPLTLRGEGSGSTIIDGQHSYSVLNAGPHCTILWIENSNVKIEGLTIKSCDWGVRVTDILSLETSEINDITFDDVTVLDNYGHGVVFESSNGVTFKNINFIDSNLNDNGDRGIYFNPGSVSEDITLTDTNANNNRKAGFNCQGTLDGLTINGGTFNDNTGGLTYEGGGPFYGAGIELSNCEDCAISGATVKGNGVNGPTIGYEPYYGGAGIIVKGNSNGVELSNIILENNANGLWVEHWGEPQEPINVAITESSIQGNTYYGIQNGGPTNIINAKNNYWGKCDGPALGSVIGNVTYTPWLGICIDQQSIGDSCILETEDVEVKANLSSYSVSCPNPSVWLEANSKTYSVTKHAGVYVATIPSSDLIGGSTVHWKFVVEDCEEHLDEGAEQTFNVNYITDLTMNPVAPNGLDGWYVTNVTFTLTNPSTPSPLIRYRWDGTGEHIYTAPFGLVDAPNGGDGLLELTWWSNVCSGEGEQNKVIYIDMLPPEIINVNPAESSLISSLQPIISATIKEPYQTNSQLDASTIKMKIDNILVEHKYDSSSKKISYVANLTAGPHTVEIRAKDHAGNEAVKTWTFTIDPTSTNIDIFSPEEGTLNNKRQLIDVLLSEKVAKLEYQDDGEDGKYKTLCKDCDRYNKTKTFAEGAHILKIMATNYAGSNTTEQVSFLIDSVKPKIAQVEPKKGFGDGLFKVKYTEENPASVKLTYEQEGVVKTSIKTDCPGGKSQICIFDIGDIKQGEVNFTFEITDVSGFKAESKKASVKIDTIAPLMSVSSPQNGKVYSNKVQFSITTDEVSDIYYRDYEATTPRWTRIASKATGYGKLVNFKDGDHEVEFKAVDPAGNTAMYGPVSFEVI